MPNHTPPANANEFNVYGFKIALHISDIFDDTTSLKAVYYHNSQWNYLSQPDFYKSSLTTKESTDEVFNTALVEINLAIEAKFKPKDDGDEPENGTERIEWILDKLTVVNNKLTR